MTKRDPRNTNWNPGCDYCRRLERDQFSFLLRLTKGGGKIRIYWRWQSERDPGSYALGNFSLRAFDDRITWLIDRYHGENKLALIGRIQQTLEKAWDSAKVEAYIVAKEIRQEWIESRPNYGQP